VYDGLGAAWDARRATTRLRAHGVRLRAAAGGGHAASGPRSLTATERKVAGLVAEGLSNPDVAERLNLSRRTVESHVSRILAKLGAASRIEVKAHLESVDP
jgi:DNA-binding NarL/FixJ family response regulator